ncbi:MAG: hypothetical protein JXR94_01115 [Candidatus Hydrogenedentes bacterium]|nr:hypothetical protein [Candidatus Hydrogenedentota bacterium]
MEKEISTVRFSTTLVILIPIAALSVPSMCQCAAAATAQPVSDPQLTRCLDRVAQALTKAQQDAAKAQEGARGGTAALQKSLQELNQVWQTAYRSYRGHYTADPAWPGDFDTINTALLAAVNALTARDTATAKSNIDKAAATLKALRDRNGVPDISGALEGVATSLGDFGKALKSVSGKGLTVDDLAGLRAPLLQAIETWQTFTRAVLDVNALGLSQGDLNRLEEMVARQNTWLDFLSSASTNEAVSNLLDSLGQARDDLSELQALVQNLTAEASEASDEAGSESKGLLPGSDAGRRERPRPLKKLLER